MSRVSGDENAAAQLTADGPLGATDVQEALELVAAAGPYYTTEPTASYTLGSGGTYTTLKSFTISTGTARYLDAYVTFCGGTAAAPTVQHVRILACAARTSGGTTTAPSAAVHTSGSLAAFQATWIVSGANLVLQFRASGAPTVRASIRYAWTEQLPP